MQKISKTTLGTYVLSYFIIKTHLFDVDNFPRTFDMESPHSVAFQHQWLTSWQQPHPLIGSGNLLLTGPFLFSSVTAGTVCPQVRFVGTGGKFDAGFNFRK